MSISTAWLLPTSSSTPHLEIRSDCTLTAHVRYGDYYKRLGALIPSARDDILVTGWEIGLSQKLGDAKTALELLTDAFNRGVRVRALGSATRAKQANDAAAAALNALAPNGPALMYVDDQHAGDGGHHQKSVYLGGEEPHFFVGGMDVTPNRFDGTDDFWLDCQLEIAGLAAERGRATFEERWRSCDAWKTGNTPVAEFTPRPPSSSAAAGGAGPFVQFVRTYPIQGTQAKKTKRLYANPDGEQTYHALLVHAIGMAQRFIYVEDQYFTGSPGFNRGMRRLEEVMNEALKKNAKLQIVVVMARSEQAEGYFAPWSRRRDVRSVLLSGGVDAARVRMFVFKDANSPNLAPPGRDAFNRNYVHTKTWIFDDELAVVGSANNCATGMANESEHGAAVVSAAGFGEFKNVPFARALRIALWHRIMNAPTTSVPVAAKDLSEFAQGLGVLLGKQSPLEPYDPGTIDDSASYGEPKCP